MSTMLARFENPSFSVQENSQVDIKTGMLSVIYQTQETVFHRDIQTQRRGVENTTRSGVVLMKFWIADQTLSRVFDISSQPKQKQRSKRRNKIVKNIC